MLNRCIQVSVFLTVLKIPDAKKHELKLFFPFILNKLGDSPSHWHTICSNPTRNRKVETVLWIAQSAIRNPNQKGRLK